MYGTVISGSLHQVEGLELIASENFTSRAVRLCWLQPTYRLASSHEVFTHVAFHFNVGLHVQKKHCFLSYDILLLQACHRAILILSIQGSQREREVRVECTCE